MPANLTSARYGNYRSSPDTGYTTIAAGTLRITHEGQATQDMWVTQLGSWSGKATGNSADVVLGLYDVGPYPANSTPGALLGASYPLTATLAYFTAGTGGGPLGADIDPDSLDDPAILPMIRAGSVYAEGPLATGHDLAVSVKTPVTVPGTDGSWTYYNKSGLTDLPDPFSPSSSSSNQGRLSVWADGYLNTAPLVPASRTPSTTQFTLTPTFTGTFRDYCGTYGPANGGLDLGDRMSKVSIELRALGGDGTLLWDTTYTPTSAEISADAFSRVYGGSTLVRGTSYEWRCRVRDSFATWSDWSSWLAFDVADAGELTLYGTPTGKQDAINGYTFQAKWHHNTGLAMTHVKVRLLDSNGFTVLQESPSIAKAAASSASPGTAFSVSFAETGFTDLDWAHAYYWAISGQDSGGDWSNYYVSPTSFTTDYPPTVPTSLTPNNASLFVTTSPPFSFTMSDPDDTVGTGLVAYAELHSPLGGVKLLPATYNGTTNRWELASDADNTAFDEIQAFAITFSVAPTGGTFTLTWNGQTTAGIAWNASDTTVKSALEALSNIAVGEVSVVKVGSWTWFVTFQNGLGGTDQPAMTANVSGLTGGTGVGYNVSTSLTGGPHYGTWTWYAHGYDGTLASGGVVGSITKSNPATFLFHLGPSVTFVVPGDGDTIVSSSIYVQWTTTDQQKKRIVLTNTLTGIAEVDTGWLTSTVSNYTIPVGSYDNDMDYQLTVMVEDSLTAQGSSAINLTIDYPPSDPLTNVQVTTEAAGLDPVDTRMRVTWDQTTYPAVDAGSGKFDGYVVQMQADSGVDAGHWTTVFATDVAETTVFVYEFPQSGKEYTFRVYQNVTLGGSDLLSTPVEVSATLDLGRYTELTGVVGGDTLRATLTNVTARTRGRDRSEASYRSPNGGASVTIVGNDRDTTLSITAAIITDTTATAQDRKLAWDALDASGLTVCLRNGTPGDPTKLFGRILDPQIDDQMGDTTGTYYLLTFGFRTEQYVEGAS